VVFGEGNRGNVYNLLNQIAQGRFVMVGNGQNRKSMAYVGNVAEYLFHTAMTLQGSLLVNYVDKPDLTMDALVIKVRKALGRSPRVGFRLPYRIGLGLGYLGDGLTRRSKKKLPFSSIRVKKFCSNTSFATAAHNQVDFRAPFTLEEGLSRTIDAEFIRPDPAREVFFTE
jgi:nucleoside-diphosphate-sugar epimerase